MEKGVILIVKYVLREFDFTKICCNDHKIQTHKRLIVMPTFFQALDRKTTQLSPKIEIIWLLISFFHCFELFNCCLSLVLKLYKGDYAENLQIVCLCPNKQMFFRTFYVFVSCFRMLAVILVSDFCNDHNM